MMTDRYADLDHTAFDRTPGAHHDHSVEAPVHRDQQGREVARDLVALMGETPLVALDRLSRDVAPTLLAKLEMLNPGGSVKDRISMAMVEAAEAAGVLRKGGTIVEPTSGNTGVGLAIVAARKGYRCVFVVPDKVSNDKIALMRAYGAEVVVCPTSVEPEDPRSYYSVSDRLGEQPGAFKPNQYFNQANPLAHTLSTGPEIWRQTAGMIDALVCGIGTGGTATGAGGYLKARKPAMQIVGADPEGSVFSGDVHPYLVEGIGEDFWPPTFDPDVVDVWERVSDQESFAMARRCTREEGVLVGGSGGTALVGALRYAATQPADATIVVLLPDSGRGYLSKVYDEVWMAEHGFVDHSTTSPGLVGDLLRSKGDTLPPLVHLHPGETVAQAIELLREFGVSQMPVFVDEVHDGARREDVLGSVRENALLDAALRDPDVMIRPIIEVLQPELPAVTVTDSNERVLAELAAGAPAVLAFDGEHAVGVLTRADVLAHLAR